MIATVCHRLGCGLTCWLCILATCATTRAMGQTERFVTLSHQHTVAHFDVGPQILASQPPILFLSITKVVNPQRTPFEIVVSLSHTPTGTARGANILVGNVSLYPPDRPAAFQLDASKAFRQLESTGVASASKIELRVELRRIHQTEPWTPVQLTVAEPEWRTNH